MNNFEQVILELKRLQRQAVSIQTIAVGAAIFALLTTVLVLAIL